MLFSKDGEAGAGMQEMPCGLGFRVQGLGALCLLGYRVGFRAYCFFVGTKGKCYVGMI